MPAIGRSLLVLLLIGPALVFIGQFGYAVAQHDLYLQGTARLLRYYVGPLVVAATYLLIVWRAPAAARALVAGHVYAVLGAVVLFEVYVQRVALEARPGGKLDTILELRAAGRDAYPAFPVTRVNEVIGGHSRRTTVVSNLPHVATVLCSTSNGWRWFVADHEGFNNPPNPAIDGRMPLPVAVIGDSFIHGMCLPNDETIVAQLQARGVPARSFGVSNHGPLLELETLKRHVHQHEAEDVVWCFYEGNDVHDMEEESRIPWLVATIDAGPADLDAHDLHRVHQSIRTMLDDQIANNSHQLAGVRRISWTSVLGFRHLSEALGLHYGRTLSSPELFARVMRSAKETVEGWGGRLHLCYLPEYARYAGLFSPRSAYDVTRNQILGVARDLDINIIDVTTRFDDHPSPTVLFDEDKVHYNAEGAAVVADAIARALRERASSDR